MTKHNFQEYDLQIKVPGEAPSFIGELVDNGGWEAYECEIISSAINKSHRVLEGGAGIGVTSAIIGRKAGFAISLEANPILAKTAKYNQKINNSKTQIINAALGIKDGAAEFNFRPDWWDSRIVKRKSAHTQNVRVLGAQKLINNYDINTLILDVEGEEEKILPHIDLDRLELLIIELHSHIDKKRLINKIESRGFIQKNAMDKTDHSVVWFEKPKKRKFSIFDRLR